MNPHEIQRKLQAGDSGELGLEETLEHAAKKLDELLGWDSLDMVEFSMALEEKGIVVTTVGELIRLLESGYDDTGM
jgi:acyl carrier protein